MNTVDRRIGLLFAGFVVLLVFAMFRAAWLQGVQGSEYRADADGQQRAMVPVPAERGAILDRKGRELAVSEKAETVIATPYQIKNPPKTAAKLASILNLDEDDLLEDLASGSGFAYVAHKVDLPTAEKVRELGIEGIGFVPDSRRIYPEGELAAQVIGTVGSENQGLTGLEASQDDVLHGDEGELAVTRDGLGDEIGRDILDAEAKGSDLKLTIDAAIQATTERVIDNIGETYHPEGATAIVMDPKTSEVLAMANWPSFDPNHLEDADPRDLQNMATGFTYEPGSTFKAFTVAGALEEGIVHPSTTYGLAPTITVADRTIEEAHARGAATMSVADILAQSSNVGAITIGLELNQKRGDDAFDHWVRSFGFGSPTGIDFPGEERGIVPAPDQYSGSTMGNLPIGQGLSVTPMQMATAYSAIANGGILRSPRLVLERDGEPVDRPAGERIISERHAASLREMLEGVLEAGGTASGVSVPGYVLAGKTGTAQKVIDGTYSDTEYVGSFVGFAPAEDPKLLVAVAVDSPPYGSHYGGFIAAPAFGEIAKVALPYLGVPPDSSSAEMTP